MALSSKFDQNGNNFEMGTHLLLKNGAEIINMLPAGIPLPAEGQPESDDWTALVEGGYFYDESGTGRKENGARRYFATKTVVNEMITAAIEAADSNHQFDPNTEAVPVRPDGQPIKRGDVFRVTVAGTWSGEELFPGDELEALTDIAGVPAFSDFIKNDAKSGLESVADGDLTQKGIVQLVGAIRRDGTAVDSLAATEKAVHDALAAVEVAMNAAITAAQSLLQDQINVNSGDIITINQAILDIQNLNTTQQASINQNIADIISANALIAALQATVADHTNRLVALEEWDVSGVTIPLGGSAEVVVDIPTLSFKSLDDVQLIGLRPDGNGGYARGAMFPVEAYVEGGVSKVKAKFASPVAVANYAVRVVGLSKAAA